MTHQPGTPPGAHAEPLNFSSAPVSSDGGFLIGEHVTPFDPISKLPLPILPPDSHKSGADLHHHFHPRKSPLLVDAGGVALRCSRLQLVDYDTHHIDYHGYYRGPKLPETEDEKFFMIVMAAAYVPRQAITFTGDGPKVVDMSDSQYERLLSPKEMRISGKTLIQRFIQDYILHCTSDDIDVTDAVIEEFLETPDLRRKYDLGHFILGQATEKASQPIRSSYKTARRMKLLSPGMPKSAQKFTKLQMGNRHHRNKLIPRLHTFLRQVA